MTRLHLPLAVIAAATFACCVPAHGDGNAAAQYKSGTLAVDVSGQDVSLSLRLPMTRSDASTAGTQNLSVAEVVARLKAADKLFALPEKARCQVENANAFAVDAQGRPTTAEGNIQAMYRFHCEGAPATRIDKLGVKLFENLPGLDKLKLQLVTEKGESTTELTPAGSDVTL